MPTLLPDLWIHYIMNMIGINDQYQLSLCSKSMNAIYHNSKSHQFIIKPRIIRYLKPFVWNGIRFLTWSDDKPNLIYDMLSALSPNLIGLTLNIKHEMVIKDLFNFSFENIGLFKKLQLFDIRAEFYNLQFVYQMFDLFNLQHLVLDYVMFPVLTEKIVLHNLHTCKIFSYDRRPETNMFLANTEIPNCKMLKLKINTDLPDENFVDIKHFINSCRDSVEFLDLSLAEFKSPYEDIIFPKLQYLIYNHDQDYYLIKNNLKTLKTIFCFYYRDLDTDYEIPIHIECFILSEMQRCTKIHSINKFSDKIRITPMSHDISTYRISRIIKCDCFCGKKYEIEYD